MSDGYLLVDDDSLNDLRYRSQLAEQRRSRAEQDLREAHRRLAETEAAASRRIDGDRQRLQAALRAEEDRLSGEFSRLQSSLDQAIQQQNRELHRQLDGLRGDLARTNARVDSAEQQIKDLTDRFDREFRAIADRSAAQRERAQCYRDQLDGLLRGIDGLHPEQLAPGQAEPLRDSRRFLDADLANGDYQAAIGVAQSNLPAALRLLGELEQRNGEYDRLSVQVRASILQVRQRMQELEDPKGNAAVVQSSDLEFSYNGDIEFWSGGLLGQLCASFDREQGQVEEYLADMDLENLRIAVERIPQYLPRLDLCRQFAREEFHLSCGVQELALNLHDALTEDGSWALTRSGFPEGDPRRSYWAVFQDPLGHTAAAVVQPNRGGEPPAVFSLDACDGDQVRNEGLCAILRDGALARLTDWGIPPSALGQDRGSRQGQEPAQFISRVCADGAKKRRARIQAVRRLIDLQT